MPSVILHMDKFKREAIRGLQSHNQRERKSNSNPDIDYSRSSRNYDLRNSGRMDYLKFIERRIDELQLKKTLRHDAVYACGLILSASPEYFQNCNENAQRRYFETGLEFLEKFVGKENIISAVVHLDEGNPHLHLLHVPVTEDGRLSANKIYTRESLKKLQSDLPKFLQSRGIQVDRGVEQKPGSAKKHLNTREYKQQREAERQLQKELEEAGQKLESVQNDLNAQSERLKEFDRQVREAEMMLNFNSEPVKPNLFNYKSAFEEQQKQIEHLKTALTNKRTVETRNRELEADRQKLASELKLKQLLAFQDNIELRAFLDTSQKRITRLEKEKLEMESAQTEMRAFLSQPEILEKMKSFQTKTRERAEAAAALEKAKQRPRLNSRKNRGKAALPWGVNVRLPG